ncbi:MAG: hypothetical protein FWD72_05865, partial [Eggerthellaceae bacterium]|nr:hypothetical protein [Eggerthellaceae bacterium]
KEVDESPAAPAAPSEDEGSEEVEDLKELSAGEISAICSSLALGCEKQRLLDEMDAFNKIAAYYKTKTAAEENGSLSDAEGMLGYDLANGFPAANKAASADKDRGALRSLVWSEKVSNMQKALLERFAREGDAMLEHTKIWVCDICGFIYVGDTPPEICPVCKVPSFKILEIERS